MIMPMIGVIRLSTSDFTTTAKVLPTTKATASSEPGRPA